ncbi:MAG: ABC transporter permease subunit [Planctomycetota bacterium]|nr:ABC transporter permease subunit [Planctomycetota bacterium]
MGKYFSIIVDSYREARDSMILTILLGASALAIFVVAGVGWWAEEKLDVELVNHGGAIQLPFDLNDSKGRLEFEDASSPGAILLEIDGKSVSSKKDVEAALSGKKEGDKVEVTADLPSLSIFIWEVDRRHPEWKGLVNIPTDIKIAYFQWGLFNKFVVGFFGLIAGLLVTAGFMPRFLETGAIHLVMSRPVSRVGVIWAKFFGGLSFMVLLAVFLITGVFLAVSLRSGEWNFNALYAIPILIFTFAQFYAFSCFVSVVSRSQIFTIIASLLFYLFAIMFNTANQSAQGFLNYYSATAISISNDGQRLSISDTDSFGILKQYKSSQGTEMGKFEEFFHQSRSPMQPSDDGLLTYAIGRLQNPPAAIAEEKDGENGKDTAPEDDFLREDPVFLAVFDEQKRNLKKAFALADRRILRYDVAPDGKSVLLASPKDVAVFNLNEKLSKAQRRSWPDLPENTNMGFFGSGAGRNNPALPSAISYDGAGAAMAYRSGAIVVCDPQTGAIKSTIPDAHEDPMVGLILSGNYVLSGAGSELCLWDWTSRKKVQSMTGFKGLSRVIAHRGSGLIAVSTEYKVVDLLKLADGKMTRVKSLSGLSGKAVALNFSGNGEFLAASGQKGLNVAWKVSDKEELGEVDLCPTARKVATAFSIIYWCFPRTQELDAISRDLLIDEKMGKFLSAENPGNKVEVQYLSPLLSGCLFIIVLISMASGVFVRRDL